MSRMQAGARRQQLLDVAAELFAINGYRATTTAELARAAGVTEPILYRHFESKLDLFLNLIEEVGNAMLNAWREAVEQGSDDGNARLRRLLAANPAADEPHLSRARVLVQALCEAEREPEVARLLRRHFNETVRFVRDTLTDLRDYGTLDGDIDPEVLAFTLVHLGLGFNLLYPLRVTRHAGAVGKGQTPDLLQRLLSPG